MSSMSVLMAMPAIQCCLRVRCQWAVPQPPLRGSRRLGFHAVAHAFLVAPEALVAQHEAHAALQLGVFSAAVAAVLAEVAGSVGLAEFHRPQTVPAGATCSVDLR